MAGVGPVEVGVLLVEHRHGEQHRVLAAHGLAEHALGAHLHAGGGAHAHERAVGGAEAGDGVALEVEEARRVEQVHLRPVPLGEGAAERGAEPPLGLLGRHVGERGAVAHPAAAPAGAGREAQGVDEAGLAAAAVAHDGHVPDLLAAVLAHQLPPPSDLG
jgi:hypothetical protein